MTETALLNRSQTFVERAHAEAESSPVLAGDPQADALLAAARERIYFWPESFSGFTCDLEIVGAGGPWKARLSAPCSRKFAFQEVEGNADLNRWAHYHVGEIFGHREHPSRTRMASRTGVTMGDLDPVYGQRVDFAGDKLSSFYRLQDDRITQIGRQYGGQRFVICIDRHQEVDGQFLACNYTAFYTNPDGELTKVETYQDDYACLQGIWLPQQRLFGVAEGQRREHRRLLWSNHQLLEGENEGQPCSR